MNIKQLIFSDPRTIGWVLDPIFLKSGMNLFVGASGSGKTRVINIIYNISRSVVENKISSGQWTLHFEHSGLEYSWKYDGFVSPDGESGIVNEEFWRGSPNNVEQHIFSRGSDGFNFMGNRIPKLDKNSSGIHLLKEEDIVRPAYDALHRIIRQRFWSEDLIKSLAFQRTPPSLVKKLQKRADIESVPEIVSLHASMDVLYRFFRERFELIEDQFKLVFPFVDRLQVKSASEFLNTAEEVPILVIKEKGIEKPIPLNEVASGMQKVLLIIVDVITSPNDSIYLIDEYENSLGINAIDFLPPFVAEHGEHRQFIVTTHHPYLINAIPVSDWFVFHRKGLHITVDHGVELETRYGKSKQEKFIKLINDPVYSKGIE